MRRRIAFLLQPSQSFVLKSIWALALSLLAMSGTRGADMVKSLASTSGRWVLVCDNTRHCEAAGFGSIEPEVGGDALPPHQRVSVLRLYRDGGPFAPLTVTLSAEWAEADPVLTLEVEHGESIRADRYGTLSTADFLKILPALLDSDAAQVSNGKQTGTLPLNSLGQILQSFDEAQGRIGTPGALVAKGDRPESGVPPAVAPPQLKRLPLVPNRPGDIKLLHTLLPKLGIEDCDVKPEVMLRESEIKRVSAHQAVVLLACEFEQHANAFTLWLVEDRAPYAVRQLKLPGLDGDEIASSSSMSFDGQVLNIATRRLPEQDCGSTQQWVWTGDGFTLASIRVTPLCNELPGGSDMPFYTTKY